MRDPPPWAFIEGFYQNVPKELGVLNMASKVPSAATITKGIWDVVTARVNLQSVKQALKTATGGSAGGPSGLTYDMLKDLDDSNLMVIVKTLQQWMEDGLVPKNMNKSRLRPLPKTENGLVDLSKTRPIALMEVLNKLFEKILFTRVVNVMWEHNMLREEQYGALGDRLITDPLRVLTELMQDAIVLDKQLHVFSADLSKSFDTIEHWSQELSWKALGMPTNLIKMLTNMDKQATTEVIIGQGRTTGQVLGEKGWFYSDRGVRQGSIGGPIKWVVFMNFWLEYIHVKMKGKGYKMKRYTSH